VQTDPNSSKYSLSNRSESQRASYQQRVVSLFILAKSSKSLFVTRLFTVYVTIGDLRGAAVAQSV
jgi:hypothetical protein